MSVRNMLLVLAFALGSLTATRAEGVRPIEATSIDLGEISGTAYYTVERDGFHVVTTIAESENGTPIRVVSVLAPGQRVALLTPNLAVTIEISRKGDSLFVRRANTISN